MRALLIAVSLMLFSACSSQAPIPSYYLLRNTQDEGSRTLQTKAPFALGEVVIAPYIDQPGLLLETNEGDLRPARFHLWAEPLREGIRAFLLNSLSQDSGYEVIAWETNRGAKRIRVRIDQFHGTQNGDALLVAHWWQDNADANGPVHEFVGKQALDTDGYGALASAQKTLLRQLAAAIVRSQRSSLTSAAE